MQGNLEVLQKEEEDVEEAVAANTKALNESLGLLQKFEGWMDRLLEENDDLIARFDSSKFKITSKFDCVSVRSLPSRSCASSLSSTLVLGEFKSTKHISYDVYVSSKAQNMSLMMLIISRSLEGLANILVEVLDRYEELI